MANLTGTAWLRQLRPDAEATTVLVCFPPGGGAATAYRALAHEFGTGTAVYAVQYPGRQDRLSDPLVTSLTTLAQQSAADLLRWPATVRLALFGHSMGATVAYETARALEAAGRDLAHLFVSGRPAPAHEESARLHLAPDSALIADLERLANDPTSVAILRTEPSLADLVLPAVRADYQAVETYRHQPTTPLRTPISALISTDDPTTTVAQAQQWATYTTADFAAATFPGRHFYLDLPENLRPLAEFVTSRLR